MAESEAESAVQGGAKKRIRANSSAEDEQQNRIRLQVVRPGWEPSQDVNTFGQDVRQAFYQTLFRNKGNGRLFLRPPTLVTRRGSSGGNDYLVRFESEGINISDYLRENHSLAFVVYRNYVPVQGNGSPLLIFESESLLFISNALIEAGMEYLTKQPDFQLLFPDFDLRTEIRAPYLFWYSFRSSYQTTLSSLSTHHQPLMGAFADWITNAKEWEYSRVDALLSKGTITPEYMSYLVKPGNVVVRKDGSFQAYLATSWVKEEPAPLQGHPVAQNNNRFWGVTAWSYEIDGTFYRKGTTLKFGVNAKNPPEELDLKDSGVTPLKYTSPEVQRRLRERGNTYWQFREKKLVSYGGNAAFGHLGNNRARYVIDFKTHRSLYQREQHVDIETAKVSLAGFDPDVCLPVPHVYLFPPTIPGFDLSGKKWVQLEVDRIQDICWNKSAFENLVLEEETKELLRATVTGQHEVDSGADLISGKGKGLTILRKPLYRITSSDIGMEPEKAEQCLTSALQLAKIWGCIILLDDADVLLQERSTSDKKYNALVAVFLRFLDYHDRIIILTTNRVGTIDEAFKSRIQVALHCPNQTRSQRHKIWRNFLNHLKRFDQSDVDFDDIECYLSELAEISMTGRQIRNAITAARRLAKSRGRKMTNTELKHVINVTAKFDTYLTSVKEGLTDDDIARESGLR
ncbi:uncharacterized protein BJX67DRAFT_369148 [Aspergillus lucknowensis]|uniref:ATPase AAA-type core domain-containing protein n=1 Tax=Aspergillus lucknowensis TaxID=176173 RepID=A0ABR4M7B3_9EURO